MLIKDCVFADGVSVADIDISQNLYLENREPPISDYTFGFQRCGDYGGDMRMVVIFERACYVLSSVYTTRKAALTARHNTIKRQAADVKALIDKEP